MAGTVLTNKGLALITKLVAAKATLTFTRVAVGTGSVPSGYDAQGMAALNNYRMDATIAAYGVSQSQSDVAYIVAQVSSIGIKSGFAITEAGVFAEDPDEGEILYTYLNLTGDPQYIYAEGDAISKFAEITLNVLVGTVKNVTAFISPGSLITRQEFDKTVTGLKSKCGRVLLGPDDTELEENETLFIVSPEEEISDFGGAAYTNIVFSEAAPAEGQNWAQVDSSGSGRAGEEATESITGKNIITGKLAVAEDEPSDAAFLQK